MDLVPKDTWRKMFTQDWQAITSIKAYTS
jgi:hypothetical protein